MTPSTDFTTLGRLGTAEGAPRRRPPRARRPRRRGGAVQAAVRVLPPRVLGTVAAVVLVVLALIGVTVGSQTSTMSSVSLAIPSIDPDLELALRSGDTSRAATGTIALTPGGGEEAGSVAAPPAFAAVDDVAVYLPVTAAQDIIFLEADNAAALPLVPVGDLSVNANPEGYQPAADMDGPAYSVAPPITGVRPATGMAALLTAPGMPILAPVQGIVTTVEEYTTDDGVVDWRVTVQPSGRTDLSVVMRWIDTPLVAPGQEVTVGRTEIGTVRAGSVVPATMNPLALPSALLHIRPATTEERTGR